MQENFARTFQTGENLRFQENTDKNEKPCFLKFRKNKKTTEKLNDLTPVSARFSWIPASEPTHLDLEKLFLLSDSMENLNVDGKLNFQNPKNIKNPEHSY